MPQISKRGESNSIVAFVFRISQFRIRFRGVILYRELSAASTAAFPTNLLEINRAFSHNREWRVPRPEDIRFDSRNWALKNAAVALANATEANFASHSSLVSLSKAGPALALALALALLLAWPKFLETAGDGHAMKSTPLLLLRLRVA